MKYLLILLLLLFTSQPSHAQYGNYNSGFNNSYQYGSVTRYNNTYVNPYANVNRVNVNGYYRSNGSYVQPYVRTAPNNVQYDNLRYKPTRY